MVVINMNQTTWLDLGNCSITHIGAELHAAFTAVIIDLTENPLQNVSATGFRGFTSLQYVGLPKMIDCPGGDSSWRTVEITGNKKACKEQKNACNLTGPTLTGGLCPENSSCQPDGPGMFQCPCTHGYHGYRCLREGTFPMAMFFGILGAATAITSMFFWVLQRRKAKTS
ncbi:all-trans retinoic acid-induced differentiation factor [Latimeria chalumnae]|uniref:all-trans retinoic acid-induced differentiation factor n=1 Tax=Latimeria chalumnae TaxID=7897 RepID=UPI00313CD25E